MLRLLLLLLLLLLLAMPALVHVECTSAVKSGKRVSEALHEVTTVTSQGCATTSTEITSGSEHDVKSGHRQR